MEPAYAPNNYELVPVLILNRFSAFRVKKKFSKETDFHYTNDVTFYSKMREYTSRKQSIQTYIYLLGLNTRLVFMQTVKLQNLYYNLMVSSSCVSGSARLAVGHVQISPITHMPQSHTVERVA